MQRLLNICEEIERTVALVYRHWQEVFADNESLSRLWGKLADDEMDHVRQVQLAKRLPTDNVFGSVNVSLETLERSLAKAKKLLQDVQEKKVSSETALRLAIKVEDEFSKAHLLNAAHVKDASMKKMFRSLARADEEHVATLRAYCDQVLQGEAKR